jgi:hypothetical protein
MPTLQTIPESYLTEYKTQKSPDFHFRNTGHLSQYQPLPNHLSVQCIRNRPKMRSVTSCGMSKMSGALSTSSSSLHNMSPLNNMPPEVSNALAKVKATIYFFLIYYFN